MSRLKAHHYDLLRRIIAARQVPLTELDGRMIRPLSAAGLVQVEDRYVTATRAGRTTAADAAPANSDNHPATLSPAQEDLLRVILRHPGIASEEVDRRTARALRARGLIHETDGQLSAAPNAAAALQPNYSTAAKPKRGRRPRRHPRAEAILKAIEQLDHALPPGAEVLVGSIMCAAEDVTDAFRKHARKLGAGQTGWKD